MHRTLYFAKVNTGAISMLISILALSLSLMCLVS
jgi:hypothetical protein